MRPILFLTSGLLAAASVAVVQSASTRPLVVRQHVPDGGIQPQAVVDERGTVHVIYFRGDPAHGDVFYAKSTDDGVTFSAPIRVNHEPGSAIATGSVRGPHLALGRNHRVHVAWDGSDVVRPKDAPDKTPLLYTRLDDSGSRFEQERNVIQSAFGIDGGTLTADREGHVYVVWHASPPGERGEEHRRAWIARSSDDGKTFEPERAASDPTTGACGCCAVGAFTDSRSTVYLLYRSASETVNRDMYLLMSHDAGEHFAGALVHRWKIGACVMSTQAFAEGPSGVYTAWETEGQVYFSRVDQETGRASNAIEAPGSSRARKHPALAVNGDGDVLFAWTERTGWSTGGAAAWQIFDAAGHSKGNVGHADSVPVWGLVTAYAMRDGRFAVMY